MTNASLPERDGPYTAGHTVVGVLTDQCLDMTVRDAVDRGYLVTCVVDAHASRSQERHDAALRAFGGYCWVTDTDTVVGRFEAMDQQA